MTNSHSESSKYQRLQHLLDIHGASPKGWPAEERESLLALVERDPVAAQLYKEAQALDQLLDFGLADAPEAASDRWGKLEGEADLSSAILADFAASRKDRQASHRGPQKSGVGGEVPPFGKRRPLGAGRAFRSGDWKIMSAALAASFVAGVDLGGFGLDGWRLDPMGAFSSVASFSESENSDDEISGYIVNAGLEEDLL